VLATVRSGTEATLASEAGAHEVIQYGGRSHEDVIRKVVALAPNGVHHIVEVAFAANISADTEILANGGSIATYATSDAVPAIPFWLLVFKNVQIDFLGSDDFPPDAKAEAAQSINAMLAGGWPGFKIDKTLTLTDIAKAHEHLEQRSGAGRVVLTM